MQKGQRTTIIRSGRGRRFQGVVMNSVFVAFRFQFIKYMYVNNNGILEMIHMLIHNNTN